MTVQLVQLGDDIVWDGINAGLVTGIDKFREPGFTWVHTTVGGWLRIGRHESVKVVG